MRLLRSRIASRAVNASALACLAGVVGCGTNSASAPTATGNSLNVPAEVDLGCLAEGGAVEEVIRIANPTAATLRVVAWTSSCECLTVAPPECELAAGASRLVRLRVDLSDEPFVGDLRIELQGTAAAGQVLADFDVLVSAVPDDEFEFTESPSP